jgi:hypothetical protein
MVAPEFYDLVDVLAATLSVTATTRFLQRLIGLSLGGPALGYKDLSGAACSLRIWSRWERGTGTAVSGGLYWEKVRKRGYVHAHGGERAAPELRFRSSVHRTSRWNTSGKPFRQPVRNGQR